LKALINKRIILSISLILIFFSNLNTAEGKFESFDGSYVLSQNWYTPEGKFKRSECSNYPETCNIKISLKDNTFSFVNYHNTLRERIIKCRIFQNDSLDLPNKFIAECRDSGSETASYTSKLYGLIRIEENILLEEFPYKNYKILLEPVGSKTYGSARGSRSIKYKSRSIKNKSDIEEIKEKFVNVDRGLTVFSPNEGYYIYANDIVINNGDLEGMVTGAAAQFACISYALPIDCYDLGFSIAKDIFADDGSEITQHLCINYDLYDGQGNSIDWVSVCEEFKHPSMADFSQYVPRYFTNPKIKFFSMIPEIE
tara:strand:- start:250 stop:1185 length:936 start_codon:yes stop_codon:yes gene_type:complete